jgi:hypothetical protein
MVATSVAAANSRHASTEVTSAAIKLAAGSCQRDSGLNQLLLLRSH